VEMAQQENQEMKQHVEHMAAEFGGDGCDGVLGNVWRRTVSIGEDLYV
jgi:hypothetical protein